MSSAAAVLAVDVMRGASAVFVTVMVKLCSSLRPPASVTDSVTSWSPTLAFVGVPVSLRVVASKLSQLGRVVASYVNVSPASGSVAANV